MIFFIFQILKQLFKYLSISVVAFVNHVVISQTNLVPNPSFEDTIACPKSTSDFNSMKSWVNPTGGSPDCFNSCNIIDVGTPKNLFGYEVPRTGNAYTGFASFAILPGVSDSAREYIQAPLFDTLIKGEVYCVEFYVSLADSLSEYAVNNIGAYFSVNAVAGSNYDPLPYLAQIVNAPANPLTNMNGWTKVSGQFNAQGGEQYITIGNFNSNSKSDTVFIRMPSSTFDKRTSYYYIDDVSVIHVDAGAGKAKGVCNNIGTTIGHLAQPGIIYKWSPSTGLSDTTIAQPIATPTITTTYYLTATLTRSGCSKTDSVTVYYIPNSPKATISLSDSALCKGENGSAIAITSSTASPYTYSWSNGVITKSTSPQIAFANLTSSSYVVTITDALGCSAVATTTIKTKTPCECGEDMYIPNIFSPNNDGKNDVLFIEGNGLINIYWGIYDRWGNLVFEAYDQTHSWDGTKKGSPVEAGVYVYYLRATCSKTNSVVSLKGNTSLIR